MATKPMPIRIERDLIKLLSEGSKRTPHKRQELIRLTLRRHLREVIESEAINNSRRITTIEPWPEGVLAAAYKELAHENWDKIEDEAIKAQGTPNFED